MAYEELRQELVDSLIARDFLQSPAIIQAMREVPRHLFVTASPETAYADEAVRIKQENHRVISTISQPSIVAYMLEQLEVNAACKVMEIGAGLGYNAALLSRLTGPHGQVYSIEYDGELATRASQNLSSYENVSVIQGDGRRGWPAQAPYDRIIATVTASEIYPAWREQLAAGGLILTPLEYCPGFTRLLKLKQTKAGLAGRFGLAVNFVSMAGEESRQSMEVDEIAAFLCAKQNLPYRDAESFLFFCLCCQQSLETALERWRELGRPRPEDFEVQAEPHRLRLVLGSTELGLSLPHTII